MYGCCKNVEQETHEQVIQVEKFKYRVIIRYCKSCGQVKAQSHIKEEKNDN